MTQSYQDLQEFIKVLENEGQLIRVKNEVDKDWEISTVTRHACRLAPGYPMRRPALLYENVKGFDMPVLLGAFASEIRVAMSLGIFEKDVTEMRKKLRAKFSDSYHNKCKPKIVEKGACQDNVFIGDEADVLKIPVPTWSLGKDAGPYITAGGTLSQDPISGEVSVGNYRIQVKSKNRIGVYPTESHDTWRHWKRNSLENKPHP